MFVFVLFVLIGHSVKVNMIIQIILFLLAKHVHTDGDLCGQFYWSKCSYSTTNHMIAEKVTPESCQSGCLESNDCTTFRFSSDSTPYCSLHSSGRFQILWENYYLLLIVDYIKTCEVVAGPTSGSGFFGGGQDYLDCMEAISDDINICDRLRHEDCSVTGNNGYRKPSVSSADMCADICYQDHAGMSFVFWQWTGGVEQRCDCYQSVSDVTCTTVAGPPEPSIEHCNNPATTSPSTTTTTTVSESSTTTESTSEGSTTISTIPTSTTTSNVSQNDIIIITGGNDGSSWNQGAHSEVEVIGDCNTVLPDLSYPRRAHLTLTTADGLVLTCGGDSDYSCVMLTLDTWSPHSTLDSIRWYSSSVTLPSGVYILGGYKTETTSSYLATGSTEWVPGPDIPHGGSDSGCAVAISATKFLLIGKIEYLSKVDC